MQNAAASVASVGLAPDLKNRVEIMASHVARNGPEFESSVKQKNAGNMQFSFLTGGEGSEYYQSLLQAHRAAQRGAGGAASSSATPGGGDLAEVVKRWREPPVSPLGGEGDRHLEQIVGSLEQMASRDAIRAGRTWIEANQALASTIAGNLVKRISHLQTWSHRLHVLFLVHDVLQTEVSKQEPARPFATAFRPFMVWMLRPAYQLAISSSPNGEEGGKILKLLSLWAERGIVNPKEAEEVKALVTAKELPGAAPPSAQMPAGTRPMMPGLVQQVQAQVGMQAQMRPSSLPQATQQHMPPMAHHPPVRAVHPQHAQHPGFPRPGMPPGAMHPGMMQPGMPGMPMQPGMQLQALPTLPARGAQTPETVPVGVMALMLKQVSKRGKDLHAAFVPYKPLDPLYTPQTQPPVAPVTEMLMERLNRFYEIVGDAAKEEVKPALPALGTAPEVRERSRSRSAGRKADRTPSASPPTTAKPVSFGAVPPPPID